jgi:hypothetical protein
VEFQRLAFGLVVASAPLLFVSCQGAPTQPAAEPTTASAAVRPTQPAVSATAAPALRINPSSSPMASPAATSTPEHAPARGNSPASIDSTQPPPSPQPGTANPTGEPHNAATQPADSTGQAQTSVFYELNGLTLEYYWPLGDGSNLSADETEILAYNEGGAAIEFLAPRITFTENGSPRAQSSGTWERYPSRFS